MSHWPIGHRPPPREEQRRPIDADHAARGTLAACHGGALGGPRGLIHATVEHLARTYDAMIEMRLRRARMWANSPPI